MTDRIQLIIKGRIPSKKNSRMIFCRGKRPMSIPNKRYVAWHKEAEAQLLGTRPIKANKMTLTLYAPDKHKGDLTNKAESVMDLLVDMKIIEDDNWFVIDDLHLIFGGVDREDPRVEIIINK